MNVFFSDMDQNNLWNEFKELDVEPRERRVVCKRCSRPERHCWCSYLPSPPLAASTTIYILQHPFEEGRNLKTAPMLYHGLQPGLCHVFRGKKFNLSRLPALKKVIESPDTLLMYPGPNATNLEDLFPITNAECNHEDSGDGVHNHTVSSPGPYNLMLLDGTWMQAKGIYNQNEFLHNLKQVQLDNTGLSEYVIRTQPTDSSLSTLETAAIAISILESKPYAREVLVRPLRAMCEFQMQHGAVKHHSKQYLIDHGMYTKQPSPEERMNVVKDCNCCPHYPKIEKRQVTHDTANCVQPGKQVTNGSMQTEKNAASNVLTLTKESQQHEALCNCPTSEITPYLHTVCDNIDTKISVLLDSDNVMTAEHKELELSDSNFTSKQSKS